MAGVLPHVISGKDNGRELDFARMSKLRARVYCLFTWNNLCNFMWSGFIWKEENGFE